MSNYPDNFCSKMFESRWGVATSDQMKDEAKKVLPSAIKEFVQKFNSRHDLEVSDKALDYAISCIDDTVGDMYENFEGFTPRITTGSAVTMQKIITTYRTIIYCVLALSLTCNYFFYTGKVSVGNAQEAQASESDYLATLASDYGSPVTLKKGRK